LAVLDGSTASGTILNSDGQEGVSSGGADIGATVGGLAEIEVVSVV